WGEEGPIAKQWEGEGGPLFLKRDTPLTPPSLHGERKRRVHGPDDSIRGGKRPSEAPQPPVYLAGSGRRRVAVFAAGARLLCRISGLAHHSRSVAELYRLPVPLRQARAVGVVRQLRPSAERPVDVDEPRACGTVHHHVSSGNHHPAVA